MKLRLSYYNQLLIVWADKYANRIFKYAYTINLITSNQKDKLKYALDVNFD